MHKLLDVHLKIIFVLPNCMPIPPDPLFRIVLLVATP